MKKNIRILGVLALTAIYCFAIGSATISFPHSNFYDSSNTSQEKHFSDLSTKLFCQSSQSENSVNNYNKLPTPNFKKSYNEHWSVTQTTEHLFKTAFTQYTNISIKFLINHRKTDIIFPFHYFW